MQPLSGIRVVDLTHALAGSFCTYQLGLQGADILKIEPPVHGDEFRNWRIATFAAANSGKRSITIDLKSSEGRAILEKLIATADVLTENFRPGVAAKLGLDWDRLSALYPRLIYCSISGFGQDGPFRDYPAIEWSVQAVSGITRIYVPEEQDQRRLGLSMLDPFSGYMGFASILSALLQRGKTGIGQRIDVGMLDAGWVLNAPTVVDMLQGRPPVSGTFRATAARFRARDREMFLSVIWPKWFAALCDVIGAPGMVDDPRFADEKARNANGAALMAEIEQRLATRDAHEWEKAFVARGIPAGVVRTIPEVADEMDLVERGLLVETQLPGGQGPLQIVGAGFRFAHDGPHLQGGVPELGEATDEVLETLGYTADEIARLRKDGVV